MLTAPVNSHYILPISKPFLTIKPKVPSCTSISFGNCMLFPILMRHTCALLHCKILFCLFSQQINPWSMNIFILRHCRTTYPCLISQIIFVQHVSGKFKPFFFTPFINLFHIGFLEKFSNCPPIIMADLFTSFPIVKQIR